MPRSSAVIGLPGHREKQVKLEATHSDMCRFNPNVRIDAKNYKLVESIVLELCDVPKMLKAEGIYEGEKMLTQA